MKKTNSTFAVCKRLICLLGMAFLMVVECPAEKLSESLKPLENPTLPSAKIALKNLDTYAGTLSGEEQQEIKKLAATIKAMFVAEYRVSEALKSQKKKELEARKAEKAAKNWLNPTALRPEGKPERARESEAKAETIRQQAADEIVMTRKKLEGEMKKTDRFVLACYEKSMLEATVILSGVIEAINERSMENNRFRSAVSSSSIARLRRFVENAEQWTREAKEAETALNDEKAIRLYIKAKDDKGRTRCALRLAKKMEDKKQYRRACEYYESANDAASAARLRKEHPEVWK